MYLEKRDINLKGMIKVDYFEYNEDVSNCRKERGVLIYESRNSFKK